MNMAICKKCGAQLKDGAKFCKICGTPVDMQPSNPVAAEAAVPQESSPVAAETAIPQESNNLQDVPQANNVQPDAAPQWMLDPQATPIKKHSKAKKVIIIAACAVLVLGGVGVIGKTFFARDMMKLFMGEGKYAQSVEETATYALTDKTVQALNSVMQNVPTQSKNQATDYESTLHVDLDSSFSSQLSQQMGGNDTTLKSMLTYINALTFKGSSNQNGQAVQSTMEIDHNSNKLLSCNMFMNKSGKCYYQLPELSKTYLTTANTTSPFSYASTYDSAKLNASLRALAKVYIDAVPSAKTSIKANQTLTVEGVTVNGEEVSVTFTTEQCKQILKKMLQTIKKDDYLYTVVSQNYNTLSKRTEKMDKAMYEKGLDSAIRDLDSSSTSSPSAAMLTVSAYVLPDGTQVARSYEMTDSNSSTTPKTYSLNLVFPQKNGLSQMAANVMVESKECASATILYNSATSGTAQISVKDSSKDMNFGVKVDFSGLTKAKFANSEVTLGTYKLSISDPDNYLSDSINSSSSTQSDLLKNVLKSTLTLTNSMNNSKLSTKLSLDLKGIATIAVNNTTTAKASSAITIPTVNDNESIVIGSATSTSESQQKLESAYLTDSMKYLTTLLDKDTDLATLFKAFGINKDNLNSYSSRNSNTNAYPNTDLLAY